MPDYEYLCPKCGYRFERNLRMDNSSVVVYCPNCNNLAKKIPSLFNFKIN